MRNPAGCEVRCWVAIAHSRYVAFSVYAQLSVRGGSGLFRKGGAGLPSIRPRLLRIVTRTWPSRGPAAKPSMKLTITKIATGANDGDSGPAEISADGKH